MNDHREFNRETWVALQQYGVGAGTSLTVDAYFFRADQRSAKALAATALSTQKNGRRGG